MMKMWVWAAAQQVERDAGMILFKGWTQYAPERVPAMWLRVAALMPDVLSEDPDGGWLQALREYGPLWDAFDERPKDEGIFRDAWRQMVRRLDEVSFLWRREDNGVWELPVAPIELSSSYRRLQSELARVAYDGVRLAARGLDLVPEPQTLDAYLWLSAAQSVRERHRFKKCERCAGWFSVRRTDAQFCSAGCRNKREAA